ncbi:MAG: 50S ribosomal protein L9 [Thermoanaerobaculia bacterium]
MDVILMRDRRDLGKRGEVVSVKPGYARNFLIPGGHALPATKANIRYFEEQRTKIDAQHAKDREAAAAVAAAIAGLSVKIAKRVTDAETLYGSVSASEIAEALEAQGVDIDARRIDLEGGIKTVGDHPVRINLHSEVVAELTVTVIPEE